MKSTDRSHARARHALFFAADSPSRRRIPAIAVIAAAAVSLAACSPSSDEPSADVIAKDFVKCEMDAIRTFNDRPVCRQSISDSWLGNLRECLAHLV
jgi:hypothetical protein